MGIEATAVVAGTEATPVAMTCGTAATETVWTGTIETTVGMLVVEVVVDRTNCCAGAGTTTGAGAHG
jgi:hypothetical protein